MVKFNEKHGKVSVLVRELLTNSSRDERIITPPSFNFESLLGKYNFIYDNFPRQTKRQLIETVQKLNGNLKKYPWGQERTFDADFYPIVPELPSLGHGTGLYLRDGNYLTEESNLRLGVIGNCKEDVPTYLLNPDIFNPRNASLGGGGYLVIIDVQELLKFRTIFFDPEAAFNLKEFGQTYLVFGGIPLQTIREIRGTEYTNSKL